MSASVVVTGMGVVTAAGVGLDDFHAGQLAGRGTARWVTRFLRPEQADYVAIAGEVDLPEALALTPRELHRVDRCTELALVAAGSAVDHAKLDPAQLDRTRVGVVIGSGMGGAATYEAGCRALHEHGARAVRARTVPMSMLNDAAGSVAIRHGLTGPCTAVATACASGADALVAAYAMIVSGEADVVVAGATEAPVVASVLAGFSRLRALAKPGDDPTEACRPFDAGRTGFVIAEAAAVLVLESESHATARGAERHARFAGFGRSSDAHHSTIPHPEGVGAASAITKALRSAGATPGDVSFVNAHGTGTLLNDAAEAAALRRVFGPRLDRLPVVATKGVTGHPLGAAGAVEAVATVQALRSGVLPPTANFRVPDRALGLDVVVGAPRPTDAEFALSNSFAFGGHNVVLAFTRA